MAVHMANISDNAQFLLQQIRGRLEGTKYNAFHYVEDIQSIAFGPLIGPDNIIPPTSKTRGQELQALRNKTTLALNELIRNEFVLFSEQTETSKIYVLNPNMPD